MTSLLNLEDLILQKQIPFPDREYILTEAHYRTSIPISALSVINHFTFITASFQDKFCAALCSLLERSLAQRARSRRDPPELLDVLSRDYGPPAESKGPVAVPESVVLWMTEKKFPRLLAFGAIDRIKVEIDQAIDTAEFSTDEARKCLSNLRLCFAKSDHVFDLEEVIQRLTAEALAKLETPAERAGIDAGNYGILKDFGRISEYKAEDVYPVADDAETQPNRRRQYWVYRIKPEHVRNFGGSMEVRPRVTLLSSAHRQHYSATFVASFPESEPASCTAWQESLLDPFGRPWIRSEGMHIWHYLPAVPTNQPLPGRRLSGEKYVVIPIIFVMRRALELVKRDPRANVDGTEAVLRNHYLLALARFLAALIRSHESFLIEPTGPIADLVSIEPADVEDTDRLMQATLQPIRYFVEKVEETLARYEFPKHNRDLHGLLRELMSSSKGRVAIDELMAQFAKPIFGMMFRSRITTSQGTEGPELVVSRLANNRAYLITDLVPTRPALMVTGIIIDIGMSAQQRGRLVQRLAEVSTFRTLALSDLPNVRAANDGLAYTALQLGLSQSDEAGAVPSVAADRDPAADAARLRRKLTRIQQLQNRLLRYNFLVPNGLAYKASAAATYEELIQRRLEALGEKKAGPHLTLTAFLQRRLIRAEGNIERAARRYSQLQEAIQEHLAAIRALHGFTESDRVIQRQQQQARLIVGMEIVALVACTYYLGGVLDGAWGAVFPAAAALPAWVLRLTAVPIVGAAYLVLRWVFQVKRKPSAPGRARQEPDEEDTGTPAQPQVRPGTAL